MMRLRSTKKLLNHYYTISGSNICLSRLSYNSDCSDPQKLDENFWGSLHNKKRGGVANGSPPHFYNRKVSVDKLHFIPVARLSIGSLIGITESDTQAKFITLTETKTLNNSIGLRRIIDSTHRAAKTY